MTLLSSIPFPRRPLIMGIVNVNDDSFSGDGSLEQDVIIDQCCAQISEGADIIDLGAESARTNREAISEEEEISRLLSIVGCWEDIISTVIPRDSDQVFPPVLSINTWRPKVIKALLESAYGNHIGIVNDMSALAYPETLEILKSSTASLLIMHSVGLPKQDHTHQQWQDVVSEMKAFFLEKVRLATDAGIPKERIIIDPGLDFAKSSAESLQVLRKIEDLTAFSCPILVPLSRKQFIGDVIDEEKPFERDAGTVGCLPIVMSLSASIVRVHNVRAIWQALKVLDELKG